MHPDISLITIDGHALRVEAYPMFLTLAAIVTVVTAFRRVKQRGGGSKAQMAVLACAALGAAAGARLLNQIVRPDQLANASLLPECGHFSLYGGLVFGGLCALLAIRQVRGSAWAWADDVGIPLALGIAIARAGCFLQGCCFGIETRLPWGVVYPARSPATWYQLSYRPDVLWNGPAPVHPIPLYEMLAALACVPVVWAIRRLHAPDGMAFLVAGAWFTLFRWLDLHWRAPVYATSERGWLYPALYCSLIVGALIAAVARFRSGMATAKSG